MKPTFFPETTHFTFKEVETVLINLPNNKSSGKDAVTCLKRSHTILTTIF